MMRVHFFASTVTGEGGEVPTEARGARSVAATKVYAWENTEYSIYVRTNLVRWNRSPIPIPNQNQTYIKHANRGAPWRDPTNGG